MESWDVGTKIQKNMKVQMEIQSYYVQISKLMDKNYLKGCEIQKEDIKL